MLLPLQGYVDAAHLKVCLCWSLVQIIQADLVTVWGVLWLIIAFIFFALGIIVGLVAFKV
jgi:hypothetical protein